MTQPVAAPRRSVTTTLLVASVALALALPARAADPAGGGQEQPAFRPAGRPPAEGVQPRTAGMSGGMTQQQTEEFFAMQVIGMVNIAKQLKAGRCQEVLAQIEEALPANLEAMTEFKDSPAKLVGLDEGISFVAASGRPLPQALAGLRDRLRGEIPKLKSKDCFAFKKCSCLKLWSPEGVDVNKPDPYGWRYLIDSHCGFHWPKIWNYDCGEPVAVELCNGEYPEGTTSVAPRRGGEPAEPGMSRTDGGATFVDGRLVRLDPTYGRYVEVDRNGNTTGRTFTRGQDGHLVELSPAGAAAGRSDPGPKAHSAGWTGSEASTGTGTSAGRAASGTTQGGPAFAHAGERISAPTLPDGALKLGEAVRPVDGVWTKIHPTTGEPLSQWTGGKWAALSADQIARAKSSGHATEKEMAAGTTEAQASQPSAAQGGRPGSAALESAIAQYDAGSRGQAAATETSGAATGRRIEHPLAVLADPSGRQWKYVTDPATKAVKLTTEEQPRGKLSFVWNEKIRAFVAAAAAQ